MAVWVGESRAAQLEWRFVGGMPRTKGLGVEHNE